MPCSVSKKTMSAGRRRLSKNSAGSTKRSYVKISAWPTSAASKRRKRSRRRGTYRLLLRRGRLSVIHHLIKKKRKWR